MPAGARSLILQQGTWEVTVKVSRSEVIRPPLPGPHLSFENHLLKTKIISYRMWTVGVRFVFLIFIITVATASSKNVGHHSHSSSDLLEFYSSYLS